MPERPPFPLKKVEQNAINAGLAAEIERLNPDLRQLAGENTLSLLRDVAEASRALLLATAGDEGAHRRLVLSLHAAGYPLAAADVAASAHNAKLPRYYSTEQ